MESHNGVELGNPGLSEDPECVASKGCQIPERGKVFDNELCDSGDAGEARKGPQIEVLQCLMYDFQGERVELTDG